jgi:hypothetical protein
MKIAFYLTAFYGAFGYLVATWGRAPIQRYKAMHSREKA